MYDDRQGQHSVFGFILFLLLFFVTLVGVTFGIDGCNRHFREHICEVEFTDGTVRRFRTHCSDVKGGNLEIKNDEKIRFIVPYDTWSFPIDKVKNWRKVY